MDTHKRTICKLVFPSLLGILLFLVPVRYQGGTEIVVGIVGSRLKDAMGQALVPILVAVILISALVSLWHRVRPIPLLARHPALAGYFSPTPFWLAARLLGAAASVLTLFRLGPEEVWSMDTGGNMLWSILPTCAVWYLVGGFLLPFLTEYGSMELLSSLFRRVARPLFRVPGRAMIDCVTSWMGSSVCGTYLTISQYESGYYNAREAATIITNFSLLSISFCSLVASMLGLGGLFGQFYLTIVISGLVCAVITPRIWPLCRFPESYDPASGKQASEEVPDGMTSLQWGWHQALARAEKAPGPVAFVKKGAASAADLMFTTLPVIMAFGTPALMIATYTRVFDYLGVPLGMYLELFGVPDAVEAGAVMLVGFADQFIPAIIGSTMPAVFTRFLLGCICILQVLYVTDVGALVLTSRVPFRFWQLLVLFLERVIICVPLVVLCGRMLGVG